MLKIFRKKLKKNNKGFTLVELIAVLAILAIISAIAVPKFSASRKNAAIKAHEANVRTLMNAVELYQIENPTSDDDDFENILVNNYLKDWPTVPDGLPNDEAKIDTEIDDELKNEKELNSSNSKYSVEKDDDGDIQVKIIKMP